MDNHPPKMVEAATQARGRMWYLIDANFKFIREVLAYFNLNASSDSGWAPATRQRNCERLRWYFWFLWVKGLDACSARAQDLIDFAVWLHSSHRDNGGSPDIPVTQRLRTSTINAIIYQVGALYEYMVQSEVVLVSPMPTEKQHRGWKRNSTGSTPQRSSLIARVPRGRVRIVTEEQFHQFLNWIYPDPNPLKYPIRYRNWILLHVLREGGFRIGELLGMWIDDIDYINEGISVKFRDDNGGFCRSPRAPFNDRWCCSLRAAYE